MPEVTCSGPTNSRITNGSRLNADVPMVDIPTKASTTPASICYVVSKILMDIFFQKVCLHGTVWWLKQSFVKQDVKDYKDWKQDVCSETHFEKVNVKCIVPYHHTLSYRHTSCC